MKNILTSFLAATIIVPSIILSGCTTSLGEFSVISTKQFDPDIEYRNVGRIKGKSSQGGIFNIGDYSVIDIPFKKVKPNFEDAIDDALHQGGGVFMANAEIKQYYFTFFIYGEGGYKVEGDVYAPVSRSSIDDVDEDEERFTLIQTEEGPALKSKTTGDVIQVQDVTAMFESQN